MISRREIAKFTAEWVHRIGKTNKSRGRSAVHKQTHAVYEKIVENGSLREEE